MLIEKNPADERLVHEVFDEYRGNIVGLVEYQKAVPGLDLQNTRRRRSATTATAAARWGSRPTRR